MVRFSSMPRSGSINLRMVIFIIIVAFLLGAPVYIFVRETITGGVVQEGDALRVDLKALGNFPIDQTDGKISDIPAQWRQLDGKRVALEGEMYVTNTAGSELKEFQLVYNIQKCCFNGPPQVQERVFARALEGQTVPYYPGLARVVGTLHVKPEKQNGQLVSLYTLDVIRAEAR